ncbi:MAG: trypsin-like peptidase domain-containing protein [Nitrospinota bacterium]
MGYRRPVRIVLSSILCVLAWDAPSHAASILDLIRPTAEFFRPTGKKKDPAVVPERPGSAEEAEAPKLNLLFTGVMGEECGRIDEVLNQVIREDKRHLTAFRLLSEAKLSEATDDRDYSLADYAAAHYRLAREAGRKAGADFVYIVHRGRSSGAICTYTHYLVSVNDPQDVFEVEVDSVSAKDYMEDTDEAREALFGNKALASIRRALDRKAKKVPDKELAEKGAGPGRVTAQSRQDPIERPATEKGGKAGESPHRATFREIQKERTRLADRIRKMEEQRQEEKARRKAEGKRKQEASAQLSLRKELAALKKKLEAIERRGVAPLPWRSSGSGFYLRGSRHIMTSLHVVSGAKAIQATFPNGERYRGRVVARDKNNDLAVVRLEGMKPKKKGFQVRFGVRVRVGERVHALGYPLGSEVSRNPSMVSGEVSATTGMGDSISQFRMTAPINSGNSGGPILNAKGELIGVSASGLIKRGVEGVRFGVKASAAALVIDQVSVVGNFDVVVKAKKRDRPPTPPEIFEEFSPYVVMVEVR